MGGGNFYILHRWPSQTIAPCTFYGSVHVEFTSSISPLHRVKYEDNGFHRERLMRKIVLDSTNSMYTRWAYTLCKPINNCRMTTIYNTTDN